MLDKLLKLANDLDNANLHIIANEVDAIAKTAIELTPEKEKELEDSVDKYFADPIKQEKNKTETEYGLDDEGKFGLEPTEWNGFKLNYEGYPKEFEAEAKPTRRYQTVILSETEIDSAPDAIDDAEEDGKWELQGLYDTPTGATTGFAQAVYLFTSNKEIARQHEMKKLLNEIEATEQPEDTIEVEEVPSVGGVKLF